MIKVTVEYKPKYRIRKGSIAEVFIIISTLSLITAVLFWELWTVY